MNLSLTWQEAGPPICRVMHDIVDLEVAITHDHRVRHAVTRVWFENLIARAFIRLPLRQCSSRFSHLHRESMTISGPLLYYSSVPPSPPPPRSCFLERQLLSSKRESLRKVTSTRTSDFNCCVNCCGWRLEEEEEREREREGSWCIRMT